jgi:protein-disulfide isomerase
MKSALLRTIAAITVLAACSRSEATARESAKAAEQPAPATATASANGSLAPAAAMPRDSISDRADRGRIVGDSAAKVWVIMASDFQCPYCKQWHDAAFAALMRDYATKGKIRMAFINMPLNIHPNAMPAAEAAMCASVQNKFWQMHDALFGAQQEWAPMPNALQKFESLAAGVGVDIGQWRNCMSNHLTAPLINADRDRARTAGVGSTPTFFVDGQMITGSDHDLRAEIEAALKKR